MGHIVNCKASKHISKSNRLQSPQQSSEYRDYTAEEMDFEKREILERLKEVEFQLQLTEGKNDILLNEKGSLEKSLTKIVSELAKTKMDWAISEEMKDECESALKSEIKFLISKLLKAKGKINEKSNASQNSSLMNSSQLNTSAVFRGHSPLMRQPLETVSRNNTLNAEVSMLNHSVSSISTNSKSSNARILKDKPAYFSSNTFLRNRTPTKAKDKSSLTFTDSEMNELKSSRNQMMKKESFFAKKYLK